MKHKDKIEWMIKWAHDNKVRLELEGSCGFGRDCVGIIYDVVGFPDYQWYDEDYNDISGNGEVWIPKDAYHKHPCVAVLGRGEEVEDQLYKWLTWFDERGYAVEVGDNPPSEYQDLGIVGMMMGKHMYARMVKKNHKSTD